MDADLDLYQKWSRGDNAAAQTLIKRHITNLRLFFDERLRGHDTEDLVNEVFARLMEGFGRFEQRGTVKGYLLGIARNVWRGKARELAQHRERFDPLRESIVQWGGHGATSLVMEEQKQQLLLDGLRRIPIDKHELLEFYYIHDLSVRDIAVQDQVPEGTVKSRLSAARAALKQALIELLGLGSESWTDETIEATLLQAKRAIFGYR